MHTETLPLVPFSEVKQVATPLVLESHDTPDKNHKRPLLQSSNPPHWTSAAPYRECRTLDHSTSHENQKHGVAKSWQAPVIMVSSFLSATILAILHDTMNRSLEGNVVSLTGPWSQQWTSRYGTALAFAIQTLFVVCVGSAFVQKQWLNLSTRRQTLRVRNIDTVSSALSNPFSLASSLTWSRNSLLLTIAVISWTLPLAAVVTPGTLSVESRLHTNSTDREALQLQLDLDNEDLGAGWGDSSGGGVSGNSSIIQPSQRLSDLASMAVSSSQILPMKSDFANQTYVANFIGPALKCDTHTNSSMFTDANATVGESRIEYLAWTGNDVPWGYWTADNMTYAEMETLYDEISKNYTFPTYIPDTWTPTYKEQTEVNNTIWMTTQGRIGSLGYSKLQMIGCQLWNSTYEVGFTFTNFEQSITMRNLVDQNPILTISTSDEDMFQQVMHLNYNHKVIFSMFTSLIVGVSQFYPQATERNSFMLPNVTVLDSVRLCGVMEETFRNITLSLFSMPDLLANTTDSIRTNITDWSNTYVYQQQNLLLAYGLSTLATLLCCAVGLHSFWKNGTSFQNTFSTYIRAVQGSDLDLAEFVAVGDTGGSPLPMRLGEKTITMASRRPKY